MHNHYYNYYHRFENELSEHDRELLNNAEWNHHIDIHPENAESTKAREAMRAISRHKYHCEEAMYGVC